MLLSIFMADFELTIDSSAFYSAGVKARFDENLYGELLEERCKGLLVPQLTLRPHMSWGLSPLARAIKRIQHPLTYTDYGNYLNGVIDVACLEDLENTNDTLLHETWHLIADQNEGLSDSDRVVRKRLLTIAGAVVLASVATDLCLSSDLRLPAVGLVSLAGIASTRTFGYCLAPDEINAIKFAEDPLVLEAYGQIISYTAAD